MTIARNLISLVLLSFIVVFWSAASGQIINLIHHAFNTASNWLSIDIGGFVMGKIPRHMFALVIIPMLAGLLTYFVFWVIKKESPGAMTWIMWSVWLVLTTILLAQR